MRRLFACVVALMLASATAVAEEDYGDWHVETETSPIDDSLGVTVGLEANEEISGLIGLKVKPMLVMICHENRTRIGIGWRTPLKNETDWASSNPDQTSITYRIGDSPAQEATWLLTSDHQGTMLRFGNASIELIRKLIGTERLAARVTSSQGQEHTVTFDITGLDNAIKPLREACNW